MNALSSSHSHMAAVSYPPAVTALFRLETSTSLGAVGHGRAPVDSCPQATNADSD